MNTISIAGVALALILLLAAAFKFHLRGNATRLGVTVIAMLLLLASGFGLSGPRATVKRAWLVLTGGLIDVGGYRLRLECSGTGSPVVIMDTGLAQPRSTWGQVPSQVAAITRVCTYDRAGLGESDRGPVPRTSQTIINELHALLINARIDSPYVLVGHSFGGQNVRLFASEYPAETVGMILVEPSHEDQYARFAALMSPEQREVYLKHEGGANDEYVDLIASGAEVRAAAPPPSIPLIVLTAQPASQSGDALMTEAALGLQAELAHLVPGGKQILVEQTGHFIQLDRPDVVISAIREVVFTVRQQFPTSMAK